VKKIAILDAHTIQTLPVARSLKKNGHYVILLCETKNSYGYYTKYSDRKLITPSIEKDKSRFHTYFIEFLKKETIDVVIPMNDNSALYLSTYGKEIIKYTHSTVPQYDIFISGYDKNKLMKLCEKKGFPHPRTFDLSNGTIEQAAEKIGFPSLIKPNLTTGSRGFAIVNDILELKQKLSEIIGDYGACHLQDFVPFGGNQYKVEIFIKDKLLINSSVLHKIRFYPQKGGSSCFNQTIERYDLADLCFNVLKAINWEGFADFDLIEDPRDGLVKIMEINPRIPACIKAAFNANVDFVENIVSSALGETPKKYVYRPGNYLRYLGLDIMWFIKSKNRFKTNPSWFKALLSTNQYLQDGSFDDLKPFFYGTVGGLLKQLNHNFRAAKSGMN